jgi:hypothetical protein
MFEYLDDALFERSNDAAFAHHDEREPRFMEAKRREICKAFESTLQEHQQELYEHAANIDIDIALKERMACYRAGWLDGIALGVMAAARGSSR